MNRTSLSCFPSLVAYAVLFLAAGCQDGGEVQLPDGSGGAPSSGGTTSEVQGSGGSESSEGTGGSKSSGGTGGSKSSGGTGGMESSGGMGGVPVGPTGGAGPTCLEDPALVGTRPDSPRLLPCPSDLPSAPTTCLTGRGFTPLSDPVSFDGRSNRTTYGGALIQGPDRTLAFLYGNDELIRLNEDGSLISRVELSKVDGIQPTDFSDRWPAFSSGSLAFDGENFAVVRGGWDSSNLYFYRVRPSGEVIGKVLTIAPPDEDVWAETTTSHPDLRFDGSHFYALWVGRSESRWKRLLLAKIGKDGALDESFGKQGRMELLPEVRAEFTRPQLALHCSGVTAAVVWDTSSYGMALIDLRDGFVLARTEAGTCDSAEGGNNNNGHRVVYNQTFNEFGLILSNQGDGVPDVGNEILSTLLRFDPTGTRLGDALPLHCGEYIGAGHAAGLSVTGDGTYMAGMSNRRSCGEMDCPSSVELIEVHPLVERVVRELTYAATTAYDQPQVISAFGKTYMIRGASGGSDQLEVFVE